MPLSDELIFTNENNSETPCNNSRKPRSVLGLTVLGITAGSFVALCVGTAPFVFPALRKICLPFVPATEKQVQNVLRALPSKSGELADIGSGDGRIVFAAAGCGFKATGYELNPWLVLYSKVKALHLGLYSKTKFVHRDLWKSDFSPYNSIVIFGVEQMMPQLETKLENELPDSAHVVACRFPFPKWKPVKTVGEGLDRVWLYNIRTSTSLNTN